MENFKYSHYSQIYLIVYNLLTVYRLQKARPHVCEPATQR